MTDHEDSKPGYRKGSNGVSDGGGVADGGDEGGENQIADRLWIVNVGLEGRAAYDNLVRLGGLAGEIRGDQRASQLLTVRRLLIDLRKLTDKVIVQLGDIARAELNASLKSK